MARRQRDHKAEYQRRKEIAQAAGVGSVRQYKRVRKTLSLPRSQKFSISSIRRASVVWSADHSRVPTSRYSPDMSDAEALSYYSAYVATSSDAPTKLRKLHDYLVGKGLITEDEWKANYLGQTG